MDSSKQTQEWCHQIHACRSEDEMDQNVDSILAACGADDPPFISDLLANINMGGQPIMTALGDRAADEQDIPDDQRYRWRLLVLRDEWGNPARPGDKIVRKMQIGLYKKDAKPYPSTELSRAKLDGSFEKRFVKQVQYTVDDKGCITCPFRDAVHFLNTHGIHSRTGYSLHTKPEHSSEPVRAPNGKQLHVWYWRFREVDKAEYPKLEKVAASKEPKRGYA